MSLPPSSAPTATGWSDSCRAGFAPAGEWRLSRRTEYNELQGALKRGRAAASRLGHTLTRWKRRAYAPNTAATAFCKQCRATALVNLEHASNAYGPAITKPCSTRKTDPPA